MTGVELDILCKAAGFDGYLTTGSFGYVAYPPNHTDMSEWLVNSVHGLVCVRKIQFSKKEKRITYATKYKKDIEELDPKQFAKDMVQLAADYDKLHKKELNAKMLNDINKDFE